MHEPQADVTALAFDERFALLVEAEWHARENKRLTRALQEAKLQLSHACLDSLALAASPIPSRSAPDRPSRRTPSKRTSLARGAPVSVPYVSRPASAKPSAAHKSPTGYQLAR